MKMNEITEGFWDDIKSGYKAGQKDYISRRAKELGITPQAAAAASGKKPMSQTPNAIRKRNARAAKKSTTQPTTAPAPTQTQPAATKPRVRIPAGSSPATNIPPATAKAAPPVTTPTKTPLKSKAPLVQPPVASNKLPTKTGSKIKPSNIDIDAALKLANSLSPEEKKKLLQDLLKSGVKVSAGGA